MKRARERSAWTALAYAAGALLLEVAASALLTWTPPAWLAGSIPVAAGILRAAVVLLRTQSVDATGWSPDLAARVQSLLAAEAEREAQEIADALGLPGAWPPDAPKPGG
jgi:hypothetical protein